MSAGTRIPWDTAYELAEQVAARLEPVTARRKCVGSVRRRRLHVGDVEFVAEPLVDEDLLGNRTPAIEPIRRVMLELGTWVKGGERMMQVTDLLGREGVKLDLYLVHKPATWGALLAIRTGPAKLGEYVVTVCRRNRIRVENGRAVHMDTGEQIPTDTEEQFFAIADVEWRPPHKRDAQCIELWNDHNRYRQGAGA